MITFTSPSTVTNFIDIIGGPSKIPPTARIACIGPVTAASAEKAGLAVDIMQGPFEIEGFVEAIVTHMKGLP